MLAGIREAVRESAKQTAQDAGKGFRGGSTGLIIDGVSTGKCTREAVARYLGAEPPRDETEWVNKQLMFEAGHTNEDSWYENTARVWPGVILREEEFPIEWTLDGYTGTGREDFIFCTERGIEEPLFFAEHKLESSLNTIKSVLLQGQPKLEHVIQTSNYMHRKQLPGELWYTLRFDSSVPDWPFITQHLPANVHDTGHPMYKYCGFSGAGKVTKILPHIVGYRLRWHEGVVYWQTMDGGSKWNKSIITINGIDNFYRSMIHMIEQEELPPRPVVYEIDGSKGHYNKCDYCDWATVCNEAGDDFGKWRSAVERLKQEALEN